jgi:hypothetical protein
MLRLRIGVNSGGCSLVLIGIFPSQTGGATKFEVYTGHDSGTLWKNDTTTKR